MKKSFFLLLLLSSLTLLLAQSSIGISPVFTLDTVDPEIEIHSPVGGEIFFIGDSHDIEWTATGSHLVEDGIDIYISFNGNDFTSLAEGILNSGSLLWEVPFSPSTDARIRICAIDSFGNLGMKTTEPFSIGSLQPAAPDGINVQITEDNHVLISWEAVTRTVPPLNAPISPDAYLILYSESPYEDDVNSYYFLGLASTTSFIHRDVAEHYEQMFYRVIAYKNLRGEAGGGLRNLEQESQTRPITWQEAKTILKGAAK